MPNLSMFLLLGSLAVALAGCAGDKGKELFETAQFEEKQRNTEHAVQLYREIIRKFPGSEYARSAEQRLTSLGHNK